MTLEEAGKMYISQKKKIDDVSETVRILHLTIEEAKNKDAPFTTCIVRTDFLTRAVAQLEDHLNHLKYVMEKEMH